MVILLLGTEVSTLTPVLTTTGSLVSVGTTTQISNTTVVDFTPPPLYGACGGCRSSVYRDGPAATSAFQTGQTTSFAAGDDGDLQKGVGWPSPRFTVATSGTGTLITDNLTGLMWPGEPSADVLNWPDSLTYISRLNTGTYLGYADWRLPSINELESLLAAGVPMAGYWLQSQGFNVLSCCYWSSTSDAHDTANSAWILELEANSG
jgi:hypothetical protein